jgi:hypothetical protein
MIRNIAFLGLVIALSGCSTAGYIAAQNGDAEKLQEVLKRPNHGNEDLQMLMEESAETGCDKCAQELLKTGVKSDPYYMARAATRGHANVVRILLESGVDPDEGIAAIRRDTNIGTILVRGIYEPAEAQAGIDLIRRIVSEREAKRVAPKSDDVVTASAHPQLIPSFRREENPNDYALIVGVEKYTDLPAATYAEADAESVKEFVRALGVPERNVATLTGARATRSGLAKQLEGWLANNVNENSTVYFYYSGHGAPDPKSGDAYLVPIDGDPQYLGQTAYPLKRVYAKLNALKAKRVIVMLDSCFSGAGGRSVLAKGARPLVSKVDIGTGVSEGKISVLAAAGGDQIAGTSDENGHGLFTYYLLAGLNGAAKDAAGDVTLKSLYGYLKPKVMDDARRANREQTPELKVAPGFSSAILREK